MVAAVGIMELGGLKLRARVEAVLTMAVLMTVGSEVVSVGHDVVWMKSEDEGEELCG